MRSGIALTLSLLYMTANAQEPWELKKDEDGIKVYTRSVQGSDMKATWTESMLLCNIQTCVAVMMDIDHLDELFPDCGQALRISQSETEQLHYLWMRAPWPVTDRDGVFHFIYSYRPEAEQVRIRMSLEPNAYPEQEDRVRLSVGNSEWVFTKLSDHSTKAVYSAHMEPGGSIPLWLANSIVEENPFRMMRNFGHLITLGRYHNKQYGFITAP